MTELAEVRRYWPRARVLRGGYVSTQTRSGSGARVRFHYCYVVKQFVFQFERLNAARRSWVTVRVLNCGDDFQKAMRAAGFGRRELTNSELWRDRRNHPEVSWFCWSPKCRNGVCRCRHVWLTINQRPRKGVRLGRRKCREIPT